MSAKPAIQEIEFKPISGYSLTYGTSGVSNTKILMFKLGTVQEIVRVDGSNILIIGGESAVNELCKLVSERSRIEIRELLDGNFASRAYTALRAFFGLSDSG